MTGVDCELLLSFWVLQKCVFEVKGSRARATIDDLRLLRFLSSHPFLKVSWL